MSTLSTSPSFFTRPSQKLGYWLSIGVLGLIGLASLFALVLVLSIKGGLPEALNLSPLIVWPLFACFFVLPLGIGAYCVALTRHTTQTSWSELSVMLLLVCIFSACCFSIMP